jgi:putative two-component system response regulator
MIERNMMNAVNNANEKPVVLVVDDAPVNITLMNGLLKDICRVKVANNGEKALQIAQSDGGPDLILLDIMMPGMDGYEVCRRLKADLMTQDIPVIFLTGRTGVEDEQMGFELGAVDYIVKPISPPVFLARVKMQLRNKAAKDILKRKNAFLEEEVRRRTDAALAAKETSVVRTQQYMQILAESLRNNPRFSNYLDEKTIDSLVKAAPLHDIGKAAIPEQILNKPGRLTTDEFEVMKTYTVLGRDAILAAERLINLSDSFLTIASDVAYSHREKWDGSGYPRAIAGEAIPIPARLMAVADIYEALIRQRAYKDPISHDEAVRIIREGRGKHFDPCVVDAFLEVQEQFRVIAEQQSKNNSL